MRVGGARRWNELSYGDMQFLWPDQQKQNVSCCHENLFPISSLSDVWLEFH